MSTMKGTIATKHLILTATYMNPSAGNAGCSTSNFGNWCFGSVEGAVLMIEGAL